MITFIYGPSRTGKTHNRDRLKEHFGCRRVVDGWSRHDDRVLGAGDLVITNEQPPYGLRTALRQRAFHIRDALRLAQCEGPREDRE